MGKCVSTLRKLLLKIKRDTIKGSWKQLWYEWLLMVDVEAYGENIPKKCNTKIFCWCRWCKLHICVHRKTVLSTYKRCLCLSIHSFSSFYLPSTSYRAVW
jgi:hypothetical protein